MSYKTFQATPVAPETFQTFQSFMTFQPSRQFYNVPVSPGNPPHSSILRLECIFYNSTVRLVSTENSTEYQLGNYRHYIHSSKKGRCCDIGQIDRFFIIELCTKLNYTYIFVCFTLRVILQGFVDPIMQQRGYELWSRLLHGGSLNIP